MAAREKAGGKSFFAQEQEERNQVPRGCFYRESVPRPHRPHARSKGKKEQPSPASHQVKNLKRQLPPILTPAARINFVGETSHPDGVQRHGRFDSPRATPQKERPEKLCQGGSFQGKRRSTPC